jgi:hypothetical protein
VTHGEAWAFEGSASFDAGSKFTILVDEANRYKPTAIEVAILELNRAYQLFLVRRELPKEAVRVAIKCAVREAALPGKRDNSGAGDVATVECEAFYHRGDPVSDQLRYPDNTILIVAVSSFHDAPS